MRAVWTFWSKPYRERMGRTWREPSHHLLAWGLSHRLASRHYPDTILVTDSPGKALLVNKLGLEFTNVSTELDRLRNTDSAWWALGKLVAYGLQDRPFVHLDTDVFLWKPLPQSLAAAPVFAQCPEQHSINDECSPRNIERLFESHRLALPAEWEWACSLDPLGFREENVGIIGGNRTDFMRYYAGLAIQMVTDPDRATVWSDLPNKDGYNQIIEQFLLSACLDYHRINPESPFRGISISYLFSSMDEAFNPQAAERVGYTHLLGHSKAIPEVTSRLEQRMQSLDPAFLRHCRRIAAAGA